MVKIEIGAPVKKETLYDTFRIVCTAGFGDGDGSEDIILGNFPNTPRYLPYLEEAIEFCERMKAHFPRGKGGYDTYHDVEGGDKWFHFAIDDEDREDEIPEIYDEITSANTRNGWIADPMTDYVGDASFDGYVVQYFDADGVEHHVKVYLER